MMLETDDVDDDYFTPVASTSLASIFQKSSEKPESKDSSLKYIPPKQQDVSQKPDDSKVTQCIFATALVGYEWVDNNYTCRGNLGFAILKVLKTGLHSIILYDSRKNSLSSTTITPTFEVTINNNQSISYYDNLQTYWSLYVNEDCIKSITSLLQTFDVHIKHSLHTENNPPELSVELNKANKEQKLKKDVSSVTDSSIKRKTKTSILNRMANMGHSVLPKNTNIKEDSSDLSDVSENISHTKTLRLKPVKNLTKKLNIEKNTELCTPQNISYENQQNQVAINTEKVSETPALYTYVNGVLVPVTSTSLISNSIDRNINNMDLFVSEQRMNNTEMRINVNRITDKVDHILQKLNNIEDKDPSGGSAINIQTSIYQKLLVEYENKIKMYEDILKTKDVEVTKNNGSMTKDQTEMERNVQDLKINIIELEQQNQEKANQISRLDDELALLQKRADKYSSLNENIDLLNKIKALEVALANRDIQLNDITKKYDTLMQSGNGDFEEKIKNIMNSTYQTISGNFENHESYSGETIKKIIGVTIKNITLNSLNIINSNQKNP